MDTGIEFIDPASAQNNQNDSSSSHVSRTAKKSNKLIPIIAIILILLALIIVPITFRDLFQKEKQNNNNPTPTPIINNQNVSPTPSPTPTIAKNELKINIQNGTGIPREAAYLKTKLEEMGFDNFDLGNADNSEYKSAQIFYSDQVPENIKTELESSLEKIFDSIDSPKTLENDNFDIQIITGTRPGVTKPTPIPTSKPNESTSSASTPTQTSTPSVTPTTSSTPTPTP